MKNSDIIIQQLLPTLSDEAAYEFYDLLDRIFTATEERYRHQIRRYLQSCQPERNPNLDLWEDNPDF
jgi:hypothetical protein